MGQVPWSRALQFTRDTIHLWSWVQAKKKRVKIDSKFIRRLEKRVAISNSLKVPLSQVQNLLKEAYTSYYTLKKEAQQLREAQLIDLAVLQAKYNDKNQMTRYNTMIMYERQC